MITLALYPNILIIFILFSHFYLSLFLSFASHQIRNSICFFLGGVDRARSLMGSLIFDVYILGSADLLLKVMFSLTLCLY